MENKKDRRGRLKNDFHQDDSNSNCDVDLLGASATELLDFSRMIENHPDSPSLSTSKHSSLSKTYQLPTSTPFMFQTSPLKTPVAAGSSNTMRMTNTCPSIEDEIRVLPLEGKCSPPKSTRQSVFQSPEEDSFQTTSNLRKTNAPLKAPPLGCFPDKKLPAYDYDRKSPRKYDSGSTSRIADFPRTVPVPQHVIRASRSNSRREEQTTQGGVRKPPEIVEWEQQPYHQNNTRWERPMVQVMPGVEIPLVGSKESVEAIARQEIQETVCLSCQSELYCINSASMVLCPLCRSFSAIEDTSSSGASTSRSSDLNASLGLGMTLELLAEELERLEM